MFAYIGRRLLLMIPTLLGVLTVTFVIMQFVPGGPVEQVMARLQGSSVHGEGASGPGGYHGNEGVDPAQVAAIRHTFGFDVPPLTRYVRMLTHYARFDLGQSFFQHRSVWALIVSKLPVTVTLGTCALVLTYLIAVPLGIAKALRRGTTFDFATSATLLAAYAIPGFVLGVLLMMLLSGDLFLHVFPLGGFGAEEHDALPLAQRVLDRVWHLVLPVTASVASSLAVVSFLTRNAFIDELSRQYVLTARAKGVSRNAVVWRHVLRNALIPTATGFPAAFVSAYVSGSLLIETLFSLDGVGRLSYDAIIGRDYPVVLGSLFVFTAVSLFAKLAGDLAYVLIDPRIHFGGNGR
ncbi:TPA: ABC transporter permease subunit [Burkholderia aenigmatica]|uniref:ABC transporter permease subunit n=1 Tax=Burkholderia sp. AU45251 TaxID=3059204 RepID=UPI002653396B|nr:ABC transporter permease subunit [Burkholderia sp. AU45251]HDR9481405.1 ABC transporter permease subunit [Burkholderia aenigmatica]MDN7513972.1 ABC transporter permease subunit [Burkholderia sp. AU45251]HDR9512932.1 ABC transporter permease subunit [Burkholderia aenigmatica]HDR9589776.1 ABC transporter permease subunit [Burkholderia aenigmatica]HDR9598219.1 ABC transporter permease subunit [Burkholderia aenigmatica]